MSRLCERYGAKYDGTRGERTYAIYARSNSNKPAAYAKTMAAAVMKLRDVIMAGYRDARIAVYIPAVYEGDEAAYFDIIGAAAAGMGAR